MPFSNIFNQKDKCREHECSINRKNIKKIFKPDEGILDSNLKNRLFNNSYKICDCIVICENDKIVIIEILCGVLNAREFKEKSEQLQNCYRVVEYKNLKSQISKIVLYCKKIENSKKNPQLRKKLINPRIYDIPLQIIQDKGSSINIC